MATLGLGISIGSYTDSHAALNQDNDLNRVSRQVHQLGEQLRQEYGVYTVCAATGQWGNFGCGQEVRGRHSYVEKAQILREFHDRLSAGREEIFSSIDKELIKETAIKGSIRLASMFFGMLIGAIGLAGYTAGIKAKERT